jgi:hypothetical protein
MSRNYANQLPATMRIGNEEKHMKNITKSRPTRLEEEGGKSRLWIIL